MQIKSIAAFVALAFAGSAVAAPAHYNVRLLYSSSESNQLTTWLFQALEARAVTGTVFLFCNDLDASKVAKKNRKDCVEKRQPEAEKRVQIVLDAAHDAGVAIPNGLEVSIKNDYHTSIADPNPHIRFDFVLQGVCPGPNHICEGHAYSPERTPKYGEPGVGPGTIISGGQRVYIPGSVVSATH